MAAAPAEPSAFPAQVQVSVPLRARLLLPVGPATAASLP
jgi:hypothetical protein